MADTVQIFVDNYNDCFYPGQTIVGKVQCIFTEEKTIRAVRIQFKGRAKTRWSVKHNKSRTSYTAEEIYYDATYNLIGGETDELHIPAGTHTYPFSYILPPQLPSSFEGVYGNTKYKIKAVVDRPWKFDYQNEFVLSIVSPLDLNYIPMIRDPFQQSTEEITSCCCFSKGSINFSVSLPATGYAVGQKIDIATYVGNLSSINIEKVSYELIKDDEFIAHHPSTRQRRDTCIIASTTAPPIGAHAENSWTSSLQIPVDKYANLLPCSIINVTYRLKVKVILPMPYSNLKIVCPLTIGTVPLSEIGSGPTGGLPSYSSATATLGEGVPFLQNADYSFSDGSTAVKSEKQYAYPSAPSYEETRNLKESMANSN